MNLRCILSVACLMELAIATGILAPAYTCNTAPIKKRNLLASLWYDSEVKELENGFYSGVMYLVGDNQEQWKDNFDISVSSDIDITSEFKYNTIQEGCNWKANFKFRPGPDGCMPDCFLNIGPLSQSYDFGCDSQSSLPKICVDKYKPPAPQPSSKTFHKTISGRCRLRDR